MAAYREHRKTSFAERAVHMRAAAEILDAECRELGRLMTLEMGKPYKAAVAEAEKCATACRYYAENAERFLSDEPVEMERQQGVGGVPTHWRRAGDHAVEFSLLAGVPFAAPALMAGNVGILKHASNVPQCALAIEDIFRRAGFVEGAFQTLLVGSDAVEGIIADPRDSCRHPDRKRRRWPVRRAAPPEEPQEISLELGGSDPFIVMPSADLDAAVSTAVTARMINNGQSCIAAKRFIVHEKIYDAFLESFVLVSQP